MRNSVGDNYMSTNKTLIDDCKAVSKFSRSLFEDKKKKYRKKPKKLTQ